MFIQWTVYSLEQSGQSLVGDVKEHLEWPFNPLQVVEYKLRHNGHHVLHDILQDVLWVFDLSGPNVKKEPRSEHQQEAFAVIDRYGLKSQSSNLKTSFNHSNQQYRATLRLSSGF